ncbi:uncharacterized protein BXZ73DRAFT_40871 [Epithele typhae]|uniref:uncharacterized protein n=1 Tax=Epithele typhae TaxID=378194 RepID=UPI002007288D|nr:uncharacterized protein BXZ73DRAFT_40871 [Epithele typhae]KAH9942453.1 hypothetical protein BXZ73DRAFT_40871 [Epithele typhae]
MIASSSRNVLKSARRNILREAETAATVLPRARAQDLGGQRRYASEQTHARPKWMDKSDPGRSQRFDSGARRTPLARYNMILSGMLERSQTLAIARTVGEMKGEDIQPDRNTYHALLQACVHHKLPAETRAVFEDMVASGIQPDLHSFHFLLKCHQDDSSAILKMMKEWSLSPNEYTYEILIEGAIASGSLESALQILAELGPAGFSPTIQSASLVITCAAQQNHARLALDLADNYETNAVRRLDASVWVDVLTACAESLYPEGTVHAWQKVCKELHTLPDEGLCLLVLHAAARHGLSELALEVLETLKASQVPLAEHHFAPVVDAMFQQKQIKEAFQVFDFMRRNGVEPFFEDIPKPLSDLDGVDEAWGKLEEIHEEGKTVDIVAFNLVLQATAGLRDLQRTIGIYKAASKVGVVLDVRSYNIVFAACAATRHRGLGDRILADMKAAGVKPDTRTYVELVQLCLTQTTYEDAFFYLEEMKALGMKPPASVYEGIIHKLVSVGDTRYKLALEEFQECGHHMSKLLRSFIESEGQGGPSGPQAPQPAVEPVVL